MQINHATSSPLLWNTGGLFSSHGLLETVYGGVFTQLSTGAVHTLEIYSASFRELIKGHPEGKSCDYACFL